MKSFVSGTHYNRCKRLHQLLSVSFEILNFREFFKIIETANEELNKELQAVFKENGDGETNLCIEKNSELEKEIKEYEKFCEDTLNGDHSKTAKYWYVYVKLMRLYREFSRSVRTGDFDLAMYSLPQLTSVFFAFNHPNYARLMVRYHSNLMTWMKATLVYEKN